MPHVHALFSNSPVVRDFLLKHKTLIRTSIAEILGYSEEEVSFIPSRILPEDVELADNLLPLELVVNSGTRTLNRESECANKIRDSIIEKCLGARGINFKVWVVSHSKNGFVEHKPQADPFRAYRQLERRFAPSPKARDED